MSNGLSLFTPLRIPAMQRAAFKLSLSCKGVLSNVYFACAGFTSSLFREALYEKWQFRIRPKCIFQKISLALIFLSIGYLQ